MAKRFTSTEIWDEDWYLEIPLEYKLYWYYILSSCNHAGLYKVNVKTFNALNGVEIDPAKAVVYFNTMKPRIRVLSASLWLIEDFFVYQYGHAFNPKNRVHDSIRKEYEKVGVSLTSIRGLTSPLVDPNNGVKDKDKDSIVSTSTEAPEIPTEGKKQFDDFMKVYGKSERLYECQHVWFAMTDEERVKALTEVKAYVQIKQEINFRASPFNWLSNRMWEDNYSGQVRSQSFTPEGRKKVVL